MKFSRKILIKTTDREVSLNIKYKTNNLTADESKREFAYFFDKVLDALLQDQFHYEDIKVMR